MNNFVTKIMTLLLVCFVCFSCKEKHSVKTLEEDTATVIEVDYEWEAISTFVESLSLEQKIAQLFLVSVDGTKASLSAITHPVPPGGYVLFSRNTEDGAEKIVTLIGDTISHYADSNEVLPYFSIDHEGGVVNRLRGVASALPSAQRVSNTLTPSEAEQMYAYAAMQLKALGIHVNIGPMAEAGYMSNMEFTGTRSYGNREKTVLYSTAFLNGFRDNGIYCVVKHFPGNTNDDPHYFLPSLKGDKDSILSLYVEPFRTLVGNDGLLMSHVIVPSFDEKNPACLSPTLIHDLVMTEIGFSGLVFSDDILMSALLENGYPPEVAISMALKAGVNVLMISHPAYWNIIPIVDELVQNDPSLLNEIDESVRKIIEAKILMGLYEFTAITNEDSSEQVVVTALPVEILYDTERQMSEFNSAKEQGDTYYSEHWGH